MINVIMRNIRLLTMTLLIGSLVSCGPVQKSQKEERSSVRTSETENLLANLKKVSSRGFMFGHHDDTNYGIGWEGDEGRSDVKSVCGDYPAVISFDLGHIELGDTMSLDKVPFTKIRKEILNQYKRGGMSSLSWHLRNPLTGGDSWDVSDTTGSWFWWGEKLCTPEEYKALWHMTVDILRNDGVDNALYAYSPGSEPQDTAQYLKRYPGDELIDLIGFDTYQFERDTYLANLEKTLAIVDSIGKAHNKVIAITETGYEGIPDPKWWTETLLPGIGNYPIAYVLVWRNARERITHFYAPYPGQTSAEDFMTFYNNPKTLFAADINSLYK